MPRLNSSLPPLWQKINTLSTFLCILFILRGSAIPRMPLKKADSEIQQLLKKWMNLLLQARKQDPAHPLLVVGANVPLMGDLCNSEVVTQTFCLLTCLNYLVSNISTSTLKETMRRITRPPAMGTWPHSCAECWKVNSGKIVSTFPCCGAKPAMLCSALGSTSAAVGSSMRSSRS